MSNNITPEQQRIARERLRQSSNHAILRGIRKGNTTPPAPRPSPYVTTVRKHPGNVRCMRHGKNVLLNCRICCNLIVIEEKHRRQGE